MGRQRPSHPHLRAPAPAFAPVLRQREDRRADVDDHERRVDRPELRVVVDARHRRRSRDDRVHARAHVLARLGLHADRGRRDAVPADVRDALQEGGQGGDADRARQAERGRRRRPGRAGVGARGQGVRPAGPRARAHAGREPRDGRGRAQGAPGQVAALARGQHRRRALHRNRALEGDFADRRRHDDGRRADRLPRLSDEVLQAGEGPREHDQRDRADDRRAGAHPEDPERRHDHSRAPRRRRSGHREGRDHVRARRVRLWRRGPGADRRVVHDQAGPDRRRSSARPAAASRPW